MYVIDWKALTKAGGGGRGRSLCNKVMYHLNADEFEYTGIDHYVICEGRAQWFLQAANGF